MNVIREFAPGGVAIGFAIDDCCSDSEIIIDNEKADQLTGEKKKSEKKGDAKGMLHKKKKSMLIFKDMEKRNEKYI